MMGSRQVKDEGCSYPNIQLGDETRPECTGHSQHTKPYYFQKNEAQYEPVIDFYKVRL